MGLFSNFIAQTTAGQEVGRPLLLARFLLLAGIYFAVARLSLHLTALDGIASAFWLPAAIALCACLAWGNRMAAAVWLGALLALPATGMAVFPAAAMATGFALEACAAAFLIRHWYRRHTDFIYDGSVFRFIAIALLAGTIGASFATFGVALTGANEPTALAIAWLTWWVGDAAGMIIGVPLLMSWKMPAAVPLTHTRTRMIEALAFAALVPTITQLSFGGLLGNWPLAYLPIPFVLWAAFRFSLFTVASTIAVICLLAVWNTGAGNGPFASGNLNTALLLLMTYLSVIGAMGLALSSVVYQRSRAERDLVAERDGLERRVRSRTGALVDDIESRKRVEQQLADAQRLAQVGSWNWDLESSAITWSDELYRIYGVRKEDFDVTPENCRKLIHPDDIPGLVRAVNDSLRTGMPFHVEHRILRPDGTVRIVSARGVGSSGRLGRITRMMGTVQDISEAKTAEASLREAEDRYRNLVELSPDALLVQQDGVFVFANPAAVAMLRAGDVQRIVGRSLFEFLHPDFHHIARQRIACLQKGEKPTAIEEKFICVDGNVIDVEVSSSPFLHHGRFASLFLMRDIAERKRTVAQMAYLAHYDSLTGLPNRTLFHQRLEHALTIAERPGRSLEILFLDLDRFKNINDTLGHASGDIVLQETANRLQGTLRESDTVARLGGDEFVVLVENVDEPHRGGIIAEKILASFSPPFMRDSNPLSISTSIGISSFPDDGGDAETLLKKADIAMYRAKETGRNRYCYYSPALNLHTAERLSLEYALGHAIESNQLTLHYQPKVDMLSNRITGMEALLRWQHPTLGSVSPQQFIPVAEESGLIMSLGYWAMRTACRQNKQWQQSGPARLKVAVNLSARQLEDDKLVANIEAILDDTELDACYLELEISESAVMSDPEKAIRVLETLQEIGVSVAIDDFGVGYSSLSYLKRFPIRAVKIDRSFVQGLPSSRGDSAIAKAIIGLAHSLECSVIAEGMETQQQYDFLRENDCDSVQGFYFSAPMPAEHFGDLLRAQSNLHLH